MRVRLATAADLPAILDAYAAGRRLQEASGLGAWPVFPDAVILAEIATERLLIANDDEVAAGVFSIAYEDPAIWAELERGEHLYLHRIARAPRWQGRGLIEGVLAWADATCRELGRAGLRMDTWASNTALIAYYQRLGFALLGTRRLPADARLLPHYHGLELALLERATAAPSSAVPPSAVPGG